MGLTKDDREWIRLIARDTAFKVFQEAIEQRFKWVVAGFILSPILGGGVVAAIIKFVGVC